MQKPITIAILSNQNICDSYKSVFFTNEITKDTRKAVFRGTSRTLFPLLEKISALEFLASWG